MHTKGTPLGYVQLANGPMAIHAMHDLLLNYTFENAANWDGLKQTVNIIIHAYSDYVHNKHKLKTTLKPIQGNIMVRTQYQFLLKNDKKTTRNQDIEITDDTPAIKYIEFQNRADAGIDIRATEYFGLSIGHSKGKPVEQIWLLAVDADNLLKGKTFARHVLKDEATGEAHPGNSGILYVSLSRLADQDTPAGELAQFLLGKLKEPKDNMVKEVVNMFNTSFTTFKEDKEVVGVLTFEERVMKEMKARLQERLQEGLQEGLQKGLQKGLQEGIAIGVSRFKELLISGYSVEEAERIAREEAVPKEFLHKGSIMYTT